ncbi:MAG: DUF2950 family protein [Lentisphaerota bacterium]
MYRIKYLILSLLLAVVVGGCRSVAPDAGQAVFTSGDEACKALVEAVNKNDTKRMMEIFGPHGKDIVSSGDENLDADSRAYFAKTASEKAVITRIADHLYIIEVGSEAFPFAIPLSTSNGKWFFNTREGVEELINRRIGRNEIFTINVCEAIAKTEIQHARKRIAASGSSEYAMNSMSETAKANSIYWNPESGKKEDLINSDLALAALEPGNPKRQPYYGYYYKALKAQGPDAPGGKKSYLVDGKFKNGFAVLAYPAKYDNLGIKSFMVSKCGVIFEKDLGENTEKAAAGMTEFNPDDTWEPVRN